ncbi:MAG TPA: ATP-grasp domain-containing protein [Bacteroidia bacterium]|jgi:carbamoyl-phosphate synthase large subunit|nr:ATP-grasp domain-containing protein [Bacteroidia bacterium]
MIKKRLLISGLGGSLFPYLHEKLKNRYAIFYVDADATLAALYPDYNFFPAPFVTHSSYPSFIKNLVQQHAIDVYIPLIDEEIEVAHAIKHDCPALQLLSPKLAFCKIAMRKDELMKELKKHNISSIDTWTGDNFTWQNGREYFVKPIFGRGSRGIRKINSLKELEAYYLLEKYKPEDIMIQECIKGQEYTVGALINKNDDVIYISCRKILLKKGITIKAVTETNEQIEKAVMSVNKHLQPKGPINIQLYLTADNEIKIFEINPRFSTTTIMSYEDGIDEIGLWLEYENKKFDREIIRPSQHLVLQRRWENVFYEQH